MEPQAVGGQGFCYLLDTVSDLAAEGNHSPASWVKDEAMTSLSGQENTCLDCWSPGGPHPNPGSVEPRLPAQPWCARTGQRKELATGHRMLFPVLGVRAPSDGPSRDLVQARLYNGSGATLSQLEDH